MRLAHAPWAPDGDPADALDLRGVLDAQGHLDPQAYEADPAGWAAERRQPDRSPRHRDLIRLESNWVLRGPQGDDEPLRELVAELMRPGEVVCVKQPDNSELLFRIVAVDPI